MTHVREVNVFRELVNSNPRDRLLLVIKAGELLDLRLSGRDDSVTSHARAHRGQSRIGRFIRGEVTVDAVHLEGLNVRRMRKFHRLNWTVSLRGAGTRVSRQHCRRCGQCEETGNGEPFPLLSHSGVERRVIWSAL